MLIFEKPGRENTEKTLELALDEAAKRQTALVVATTTGQTALAALAAAAQRGMEGSLVIVSHAYGTRAPGKNAMSEDIRAQLLQAGAKVVTAAHALSGVERGLSSKLQGVYPAEIMAHTLRMLSQGVKVVVEIAVMALDAGAIPYGVPVVAVGGTGGGADTAALIAPAHAQDVLSTKLHELYCKPY
jgi:hypothetical protein